MVRQVHRDRRLRSGVIQRVVLGLMLVWTVSGSTGAVAAPVDRPIPGAVPGAGGVKVWIAADEWSGDLGATLDRLTRFVSHGEDGLAEVDRHIAAANWLLAVPLAEPASALMLELPAKMSTADAARVVQAARAQLDSAARIWQPLSEAEDLDDDDRWSRTDRIDGLQAFIDALTVVWSVDSKANEAGEQALRDAASALSIVLESDRKNVADAGQLWQSYLYRRAGSAGRSFDLLPPALKQMSRGNVFGYYSRLFRCYYAGTEHGTPAAALALLSGIESQSSSWFETDVDRDNAKRLAAYVRRRVLSAERERFKASNNVQQVGWYDEAIARLDKAFFARVDLSSLLSLPGAAPAFTDLQAVRSAVTGEPGPPPDRALTVPPRAARGSED